MPEENKMSDEQTSFNWNRHWFTEKQIMDAPIEAKIDKLMDLTSAAAVNAAFQKWVEDWLFEELEANGITVLEKEEDLNLTK